MIEAKELRIGNLVDHISFGVVPISAVAYDALMTNYENNNYWDDLKFHKPIPLTEEWLIKFGFNENGEIEDENFLFQVIFYDCWRVYYEEKEKYGNAKCYLEGYYNMHELQNLYFSLTKTELQLNE